MKLADIYEFETGHKAIYRKKGADFHTLRYVKWLEKRTSQQSPPNDAGENCFFRGGHGCQNIRLDVAWKEGES